MLAQLVLLWVLENKLETQPCATSALSTEPSPQPPPTVFCWVSYKVLGEELFTKAEVSLDAYSIEEFVSPSLAIINCPFILRERWGFTSPSCLAIITYLELLRKEFRPHGPLPHVKILTCLLCASTGLLCDSKQTYLKIKEAAALPS